MGWLRFGAVRDEPKESDGALFLVRDRYGDDCRGVALFRFSGPNEALVAEVDRNTGSVAAPDWVGAHVGRAVAGVCWERLKLIVLCDGVLTIDMMGLQARSHSFEEPGPGLCII